MKSKKLEIAGAGLIAAVAIACGDAAMSGGAGMLSDAGEMLVDAGQMMIDGGEPMQPGDGDGDPVGDGDGDGDMMSDAGEIIRDAGMMMMDAAVAMTDASDGALDSATAQSCGSCTAGERQMIVTADHDVQQLRSATVERGAWSAFTGAAFASNGFAGPCGQFQARASAAELVEGPIVLTDVHVSGAAQIFAVESGSPCHEIFTGGAVTSCTGAGSPSGSGSGEQFRRPSTSRTLFVSSAAQSITGARVFLPANQTLCALVISEPAPAPATAVATATTVLWSGFVPYE